MSNKNQVGGNYMGFTIEERGKWQRKNRKGEVLREGTWKYVLTPDTGAICNISQTYREAKKACRNLKKRFEREKMNGQKQG